ncbi:MAG: hypothetical protein AAF939_16600, partial [Planctomycetota bacterium]
MRDFLIHGLLTVCAILLPASVVIGQSSHSYRLLDQNYVPTPQELSNFLSRMDLKPTPPSTMDPAMVDKL